MQVLDKLLLAAGFGKSVYGRWRIQRMMATVAVILMLAVAVALLGGFLLIVMLYALHAVLLGYGLQPLAAFCITAAVLLALVLSMLMTMRRKIAQLQTTMSTPVGDVTDAFFDGLFSRI